MVNKKSKSLILRIKSLITKRHKIPSKFWVKSETGELVCWILDREDGTADSYETSQERLGLTLEGNVIWGFASGCSCWDGWRKEDYLKSRTYKEFIVYSDKPERWVGDHKMDKWGFVEGWENEALTKIEEIEKELNK